MNFQTMKTVVALNCNNLQSSDPVYTYLGQNVNDGVRMMVARALRAFPNYQLFPEHKDYYWTPVVTVADTNTVALNSDTFAVQRVYSADASSSPNLNNTQWRILTFMDAEDFDQLARPTTQTGYPICWTIRKSNIELWPTPRTGYTTYIKMDGVDDEPDMSANGDTPRVNARWHPAILDCATYLTANMLNQPEEAKRWLTSADDKILSTGAAIVGLRNANFKRVAHVTGAPQ